MDELLIIQFAKWPVVGQVKTRLAHSLGNYKALAVHLALMEQVLGNLVAAELGRVELWLNQYRDNDCLFMSRVMGQLSHLGLQYRLQSGGSLGRKMANAFEQTLKQYNKVIIVGSDCPTVDKSYLEAAVAVLDQHDLVIGPAEDGGYVLIGARRFDPGVFTDVEWGSNSVLAQTLSNIQSAKLSCGLLEQTWNVDELKDYQRWQETLLAADKAILPDS